MWTKIKTTVINNLGLKILAVFFAVALWLVVVNMDDPNQTKTFTTNVTVINEQVLTDAGKYYNIVDDNNTVSFRVTAKRSVIERLSNSDFVATADMNYLEDNSRVPIDIAVNRYADSISISAKTQYLEVEIGNEMSSKYVIDAETTGTLAEGCAVGETSVTPNVVTVTGPAKIVSQIDRVTATCDVTGMSSDITESVVPIVYDKDGKQIDVTELTLSVTTVDVSVKVVNTKMVNINVETSGSLPGGLELDSVSAEPNALQIKGDGRSLNSISSITIPDSVINLSQISADFTTTVDITSYLPEDVSLVDPSQAQVTIKVKLATRTNKTFNVPTANLTVKNLDDGHSAVFVDSSVTVNITGLQTKLSELSAGSITGSVDVSGLAEGTHPANVVLNLEEEDYQVAVVTVRVKITAKQ